MTTATASRSEEKKPVWIIVGWTFLVFALVGLVLPVIPQVPFAIAAAYCFSKGSPKLHRWMLNHKKMGPPIRDWEEHRVVRPKLKAFSTVALLIGAGLSISMTQDKSEWLQWGIPAVMLLCIVFVLTRKSRP